MSIPTPSASSLSFSDIDVINAPSNTTTTVSPKDISYTTLPFYTSTSLTPTPFPPSEITLLRAPAAPFQPSNEDTISYSHLTGYSYASSVFESNDKFGGFCAYHQQNPTKIESICNGLDNNVCSSTQCCVLLGGEKCVAGNERGPTNYSNYTDPIILHRDLYYYQGKCYGNCPNTLNTNLVPASSASTMSSIVNSAPVSSSISSVSSYSQGQSQIPGQMQIMGQVPVQTSAAQVPLQEVTVSSETTTATATAAATKTRRPAARFTGKVTTRKPS